VSAHSREVTIIAQDVGPVGGMELQLTELITGLLGNGFAVTVIASTCQLSPHPGLRWVRVWGPTRPFAIAYPWFLLAATLLVGLRGRGVVHSTGAMTLGRAAVSTVHYCHRAAAGLEGFARVSKSNAAYRLNARIANRLSLWGEAWCYSPRRVDVLVGVSQGVVRELDQHFPRMRGRVIEIPNGVDTERFVPVASPRPPGVEVEAVFVGGDWERKGLRLAIEAVALSPGARLTVVGPGDVEAYRGVAAGLGIADRIEFAGPSEDVASSYRRADVFLLPTAYETFSLVTYEAAASGLPLLVTRVNGVEDLLRDGSNGWFIERDAESIAARLRQLAVDPELRARMGRQAREDSLRYSWSRVVDEYVELYGRLSRSALPASGSWWSRLRRRFRPGQSPRP
jgi:glycosyltransferase involved in cell wall biosynthesis